MSCLRISCCILAVLALLGGCSDDTSSVPSQENPLTGTRWIFEQWLENEQIQVFTAVDDLEGDVVGYAFDTGGDLTHRSFGFCATPPLSYFDVSGAWALAENDILELAYPGSVPGGLLRFEVVRQTREQLQLRPIAVEPPAHAFLEGTWKGTFTSSSTNPQVGAPVEIGQVEFIIEGMQFRVINDQPLVPPPAQGVLAVGETIVLRDLSMHTADYDWHLNINGHFLWKLQDGVLVLHQDMRTRAVAREFRLRRQED